MAGKPRKPPQPDPNTLERALAAVSPPKDAVPAESDAIAELNEAIRKAITQDGFVDLYANLPDSLLVEDDTTRRARITYPLAYLRLINYLKAAPMNPEMAYHLAYLAKGYIDHIERSDKDILKLGHRSVADARLKEAVDVLRAKALNVIQLRVTAREDREWEFKPRPTTAEVVEMEISGSSEGGSAPGAHAPDPRRLFLCRIKHFQVNESAGFCQRKKDPSNPP